MGIVMTDYWVLHSGRGTDGGFGDYSPPYWSDEPVKVEGRTIWFETADEAHQAVKELNKLSAEAFYSVGVHDTYDGEFPVEYEGRLIRVPESGPVSAGRGVQLVEIADGESWKDQGWADYDDSDGPAELDAVKADEVVTDAGGMQWKWNSLGTWYLAGDSWVKLDAKGVGA